MRLLLLTLASLFFWNVAAQIPDRPNQLDSLGNRVGEWVILYDSTYENVVSTEDSAFYFCLVNIEKGRPKGTSRCYYKNGVLQFQGSLLSIEPEVKHGLVEFFYPLGQIQIRTYFENDLNHGHYEEYYENGKLMWEGEMANDSTAGNWKGYYQNGQMSSVGDHIRNKRENNWIYYYEDGKIQSKGSFRNDQMHGQWEFYHENGQLSSKGLIENGLYKGPWTFYFDNGNIDYQTTFVNDLADGEYLSYFENGQLAFAGTYKKNKKHGYFKYYHPNGQLADKGLIQEDLYEGPWISYFDNGNLKSEGTYVHDKTDGYWTYYFANGKKKSEGTRSTGVWNGHVKYYDSLGFLDSEGEIINALYQGKWKFYYASGSVKSIDPFVNDTIWGYREYYWENGQLNEKGILNGRGNKQGPWEFYYENGQLEKSGNYKQNVAHGYFEYYFPNGQLQKKGTYVDGMEDGFWIVHYENGNLKAKGDYVLGKRIGHWEFYFENGQLSTQGMYEDGNSIDHWIYYYDNGNKKSEGAEFGDQRIGLWKYYYEDGSLHYSGYTKDGDGYGEWRYYDTLGNLTTIGHWENNEEHGKWTDYKDGKKTKVAYWENGVLQDFYHFRDSAVTLLFQGKYDEAKIMAKIARKKWKKEFTKADNNYYKYWSLKAKIYEQVNKYDQALKYYNKAIDHNLSTWGPMSLEVGLAYNEKGLFLSEINKYDEAIVCFKKALEIESSQENRLNDYSVVLTHLAESYGRNNEFEKGMLYFDEHIDRLMSHDTIDNEAVIYISMSKADLYNEYSKYDSAINTYQELLVFMRNNNLETHEEYPEVYRELSYCFESKSDYQQRYKMISSALEAHRARKDSTSLEYTITLNELGDHFYAMGLPDSSFYYYEKNAILSKSLGLYDSYQYYKSLLGVSKVYIEWFQYGTAQELLEFVIDEVKLRPYITQDLVGKAYHGLAICNYELYPDKPEHTEATYKNAIEHFVNQGIQSYNDNYVHSLYLLGGFYKSIKSYKSSIATYHKILDYLDKFYKGKDTYYHAVSFRGLGQVYNSLNQYEIARDYYLKALPLYDINKIRISDKAWLLTNIATTHANQTQFVQAEKYVLEAIEIAKVNYGANSLVYAQILTELAYLKRLEGEYKTSIALYRQSLSHKEELIGIKTDSYINTLLSLSIVLKFDYQYMEALKVLAMSDSLIQEVSGKVSSNYMDFLQNKADVIYALNQSKEAEGLYKEMLSISEKTYGKDHPSHSYYLREIGKFYKEEGRYSEAFRYFKQSLAIVESTYGKQSQAYAYSAEYIAQLHIYIDQFYEAEMLYMEINKIHLEVSGENSWDYISSKEDLALLHDALGRFDIAESEYEEVLRLMEKNYGKLSWNYTDALENLAYMYHKTNLPKAVATLKEAISIIRQKEDFQPEYQLSYFNALGRTYLEMYQIDSAEYYLTYCYDFAKANEMLYKQYVYANNLSFVHIFREEYQKAEDLLLFSEKMFENREVVTRFDQINFEDNLAALYLAWGKMDLAEKYWTSVTDLLLQEINENFTYLSESEKAAFWDLHKDNFEYFNSYGIKAAHENPKALGQMFDNQLQTKSILLSTSTKERRRILNSGDSLLIEAYFNYVNLKESLARYYGYTDDQIQSENINMDSLETAANDLEKQLSIDSEQVDLEERIKNIKWKDIQRNLKDHEAAVEIIRFRYFHKSVTDSVLYAALILTSETNKNPILVLLPNGDELENKYFSSYRKAIQFKTDDKFSRVIKLMPIFDWQHITKRPP